jgi:hypothetical protein
MFSQCAWVNLPFSFFLPVMLFPSIQEYFQKSTQDICVGWLSHQRVLFFGPSLFEGTLSLPVHVSAVYPYTEAAGSNDSFLSNGYNKPVDCHLRAPL